MAHIHLADGSFTLPWALFWWFCALFVTGIALVLAKRGSGRDHSLQTITLASFLAVAIFAVFQIEIPVMGGIHLSLTPFAGILAGPVMGVLIFFIINIFSAAIGHGGWSLIGANLLVNFVELVVAALTWRGLQHLSKSAPLRGGVSALIALLAGNAAMLGIVLLSGVQGEEIALGWLSLLALGNLIAAIVESFVTGLVFAYIVNARPDLLADRWAGESR